jgi:hypothetical protein
MGSQQPDLRLHFALSVSFPLPLRRSGGRVEPGPGGDGEQLHVGVGKDPVIAEPAGGAGWQARWPRPGRAGRRPGRGRREYTPGEWGWCPAGGRPPWLPSGPSRGSGQRGVVVPGQPVRALVDAAGPLLGVDDEHATLNASDACTRPGADPPRKEEVELVRFTGLLSPRATDRHAGATQRRGPHDHPLTGRLMLGVSGVDAWRGDPLLTRVCNRCRQLE